MLGGGGIARQRSVLIADCCANRCVPEAGQPCGSNSWVPDPHAEVVDAEWATFGSSEDQRVGPGVGPLREVLLECREHDAGDGDGAETGGSATTELRVGTAGQRLADASG